VALPPFRDARIIERRTLDLVSLRVVVPRGSAADPEALPGLAAITAEMMEQGAGDMDGFALALAAERIGADIAIVARRDYSIASVDVVASKLEPALTLLADVILRPRFDPDEWARTKALWLEDLQARAFDSPMVAAVVSDAALYGRNHPYGRPTGGLISGVREMQRSDVLAFHRGAWRVDGATFIAVGKITEKGLRKAIARAFVDVPKVDSGVPRQISPTAPTKAWPRFVIVDRPGSPQTVLRLAWPGPTLSADRRSALELVNFALGGSFTSRLNSNLREDKGYTYGAWSRLPMNRGAGAFVAGASVQSEVTGKSLTELLGELERIAASGPTADELAKARASLRNVDVEAYEEVSGAADRLALIAGLGLEPRHDAHAAAARLRPTPSAVADAARFPFPDPAQVAALGDRKAIETQLAEQNIDLGPPELRDAEGR
jgi:predicted Zn-dependent peptidase